MKSLYFLMRPLLNVFLTETFMRSMAGLKQNLVLVAPMKVGSTWLSELLVQSTGWGEGLLAPSYCQREQEIDLRYLVTKNATQNRFFTHLHLKYSDYSRDVFLKTNSKVILMSRRIDDTLMSLLDHCTNISIKMPPCYLSARQDISNWTFEDKAAYLADFALPWYFTFYSGWLDNMSSFANNLILVKYEDMLESPESVLASIHEKFGIPMTKEAGRIVEAVKGKETLKNKAVSGRGKTFPPAVHRRIEELASYYKHIDFTPIGIRNGKLT